MADNVRIEINSPKFPFNVPVSVTLDTRTAPGRVRIACTVLHHTEELTLSPEDAIRLADAVFRAAEDADWIDWKAGNGGA